MPATTYSGNKILDLLTCGVEFAPPARVFISLHTADSGLNGANEVTTAAWPAYKRMDPAAGAAIATGFVAANNKKTENTNQMLYPTQNGAQLVTVTHWALWDAATGGNCLWTGKLKNQKILDPDDEIVIHIGEIDLEVD